LNQFRSHLSQLFKKMSWYQMHFETEAGKPRYDPFVPSKRECHSINVVGNQLVLFGG
jgi:hypothetical protein